MDYVDIFPSSALLCILIAILFYRKEGVGLFQLLCPFLASSITPHKFCSHLKKEGVILIHVGALLLLVSAFLL